jgi:plasmid stability protein
MDNTLHVRNVPSEVYQGLRRLAKANDSTISAEVIRLLRHALRIDRDALRSLVDEFERSLPALKPGAPSATEVLRQLRDAR